MNQELRARASRIKLLLMDCDGVMTDGRLYYSAAGEALKIFHVRDGQGISDWHHAGFESGIISGRGTEGIVESRARELGMRFLRTGSQDKSAALDEILAESGFSSEEVAFIGDDRGDICILKRVGFPVTVADGISELDEIVIHKTNAVGGHGAVRELIDLLISLKGSGQG